MDDIRLGRTCRALRRRLGWRQTDLAARVGCHQTTISRLERGHFGALAHDTIRRAFGALDARYEGSVSWRGGQIDRLLDERHAALVDATIRRFSEVGWEAHPEVSFSSYGERGSIDILALSREHDVVIVVEVKSGIWNVEETIRRHDVKARHARRVVEERFGWRPKLVVRVLVVPDNTTVRRQVEKHAATFASAYPGRTRDFGQWLPRQANAVASLVFLPAKHGRSLGQQGSRRAESRRPSADRATRVHPLSHPRRSAR